MHTTWGPALDAETSLRRERLARDWRPAPRRRVRGGWTAWTPAIPVRRRSSVATPS